MSERGSREGGSRRSSFRKSLAETSLPPQYLAQLEEKRKQLDESIHKYIAAKEREYKVFEKDLRQQHRAASSHDAANGSPRLRSSAEATADGQHAPKVESPRMSAVDALLASPTRRALPDRNPEGDEDAVGLHDRSTIAGLKDRRASLEREKDFVGVFTPSYLPALEYRENAKLERASSAPEAVQPSKVATTPEGSGSLERANSDSVMQAKPRQPSHLVVVQRTSSSGSSADGKLASALKNVHRPKRKQRVSLAVGDSIVAPSDSVPLSLSQHSSSSHSRIRPPVPDRELPISKKQSSSAGEERRASLDSSLQIAEDVALTSAIGAERNQLPGRLSAVTVSTSTGSTSSPKPGSSTSKIDADGDLFDLEAEGDDDDESVTDEESLSNDVDNVDEGISENGDESAGRVNIGKSAPEISEGAEVEPGKEKYDPTTGLIPEPVDGTDSAAPYLAFGPSSAVASQQPTQPGFRRPSVVYDPIYRGTNYTAAERDAVDNEIYGSSFNRPGSKGSFTAGSLGQSYMAQHAEDMMKLRNSRHQAQVRS